MRLTINYVLRSFLENLRLIANENRSCAAFFFGSMGESSVVVNIKFFFGDGRRQSLVELMRSYPVLPVHQVIADVSLCLSCPCNRSTAATPF